MYKRKEVIEEEHLDWDKKRKDSIQDKNIKISRPPQSRPNKIHLNQENELENKNIKQNNVISFFNENEYILLALIILIVPYLVGVLFNAMLFIIYSGITLDKIFTVEKQHKIIELWSIGAYTFVTLGIVWILFKNFKEGR